jgi:hypothetical protein
MALRGDPVPERRLRHDTAPDLAARDHAVLLFQQDGESLAVK